MEKMKSTLKFLSLVFLIAAAISGCRREDFREMTIVIPALSEINQQQIVKSLAKYQGVDHASYKWDFTGRKLTLRYDSMKIAQSNIRYAINETGIRVIFPVKD